MTTSPEPMRAARSRVPTIARALRAAASDVYFQSWRIVAWNVVWGVGFLVALWAWSALGLLPALLVATLLAVPTAALARLSGLAVRGGSIDVRDGLQPFRHRPLAVLGGGAGILLGALVCGTNVATGLLIGGPLGWGLATFAAWGLLGTAAFAVAVWPLLADPARDGRSSPELARLAALVVLAHPGRQGALVVVLAILLVISTVLFAALLTIAIGFALALACRRVLPAADVLDERLADRAALPVATADRP